MQSRQGSLIINALILLHVSHYLSPTYCCIYHTTFHQHIAAHITIPFTYILMDITLPSYILFEICHFNMVPEVRPASRGHTTIIPYVFSTRGKLGQQPIYHPDSCSCCSVLRSQTAGAAFNKLRRESHGGLALLFTGRKVCCKVKNPPGKLLLKFGCVVAATVMCLPRSQGRHS